MSLVGGGIVPGERNEILEQEFADEHGISTFARAYYFHSDGSRFGQKTPPFLDGHQQRISQMGQFVQNLTQTGARNAKQFGPSVRHSGDDHGTPRQQVNVSGKLARAVHDDASVSVRRIQDFYRARFDHI